MSDIEDQPTYSQEDRENARFLQAVIDLMNKSRKNYLKRKTTALREELDRLIEKYAKLKTGYTRESDENPRYLIAKFEKDLKKLKAMV